MASSSFWIKPSAFSYQFFALEDNCLSPGTFSLSDIRPPAPRFPWQSRRHSPSADDDNGDTRAGDKSDSCGSHARHLGSDVGERVVNRALLSSSQPTTALCLPLAPVARTVETG